MFVTRIHDIEGTARDVQFPAEGFRSLRLLLARDGMGFSVHQTRLPKGLKETWHYTRHLEACYCVSGRALVTDLATGESHIIEPETLYALDQHDRHQFEALEDTVLLSIFNPPVTGTEKHQEDGSYE